MKITDFNDDHLITLMDWFPTKLELLAWAGPNFRYPFNRHTFKEDLNLKESNSFVLMSDLGEFLAFGQFYNRLDKCHLSRLVVAPNQRGKGIVSVLIDLLSNIGMDNLGVSACSLFVLKNNRTAISAYEKKGFVITEYPEKMSFDGSLYMVKQ